MYPPQTSLIPTLVALTQHIEKFSFSGNYPFWYLGTTPTKYLVGPIVPAVEILIKNMFGNVSYFDITIYLIILSYILGIFGWVKFLGNFIISNKLFLLVVMLFFLPWRLFYSFTLSEPTLIIARNFLPWVLIVLSNNNKYLTIASLVILLLINTSVLPIILIAIFSISVSSNFKNLKRHLLDIVVALFITTFWYTPSFWWTLLSNPSIGGASGIKVFIKLLETARNSLPVILALITVWYKGKKYTRYEKFVYTWVLSFLFLTVFRFVADWDYWMDWSFWFFELELGIVLLFTLKPKLIWLSLISLYIVARVHLTLGSPAILSTEYPPITKNLMRTKELIGDKRIFLSGSSVFWANAVADLYQVRGGRDQVSQDSDWTKAAYEFREGDGLVESKNWLDKLDINYVLIHTEKSQEYYHDFKNQTKWDRLGKIVWEENGDVLYKI